MIAASERTILLADAEKFSMGGIVRICAAEELDAVVTDAPRTDASVAALADAGVDVVAA
jgi:DeoR/GlpR family transcriptional regulator of sugar metabolism